jgi:hypothetical protein
MKAGKKMSRKEAMKILMNGAIRFGCGVGLGISTGITADDKRNIWEAVHVIWPYIYGREMTESDEYNTHFSIY